jgi:hypothetical protein
MVTQEDLDRATACEPKATQTRAQHTAATGRRGPQRCPSDETKMPVLPGKATLCDPPQNRQVGREGLEVVQETSGNDALAVEGNVKCNALADNSSAIGPNLQRRISSESDRHVTEPLRVSPQANPQAPLRRLLRGKSARPAAYNGRMEI